MTRVPRLAAVAAVAALVLSGCGGAVRAGAAATVGDERITTTALRDVVTRGLADPSAAQTVGADRPAFERSVLARMIQHLVLVEAARVQRVAVTGGQIDAAYDRLVRQLGGEERLEAEALKAGIARADLRGVIADLELGEAVSDVLTADVDVPEAVLRKAYADNIAQYDQVRSAHILVPTLKQAQELKAKAEADPAGFAALAGQFSQDSTTKGRGGDLGYQGRGALEKSFETAIFGADPGTFVLARSSFGFHVIHVVDRRTTTFEQATNELRRVLLQPQRQEALGALLAATVKRVGVHVSPRFGTFDPLQEAVVAPVVCAATAFSSPSARPDDPGQPQATPSPGC